MSSYKFEDVDKEISKEKTVVVHYVPFKVEYEGKANVKNLFTDNGKPHPEISEVTTNRFRGRPLAGKNVDIPDDYKGVVLSNLEHSSGFKTNNSEGYDDEDLDCPSKNKNTFIRIVKRFDSMTYWSWDKTPSVMDAPDKLMDWLELSQILHEPVRI